MTYEEMQKTMQFILEQQAQFTANQQQAEERVSRLETNMAEMSREVRELTRSTGERASRLEANVTDMSLAMSEMARTQAHMNEVVAVMVETHRHTEEKLDAFIGVLERYISEGMNGKGGGGDAA